MYRRTIVSREGKLVPEPRGSLRAATASTPATGDAALDHIVPGPVKSHERNAPSDSAPCPLMRFLFYLEHQFGGLWPPSFCGPRLRWSTTGKLHQIGIELITMDNGQAVRRALVNLEPGRSPPSRSAARGDCRGLHRNAQGQQPVSDAQTDSIRSTSSMSKSDLMPTTRTRRPRRWRQDLLQSSRHSPPSATRSTG
jgi:hypothetical protein